MSRRDRTMRAVIQRKSCQDTGRLTSTDIPSVSAVMGFGPHAIRPTTLYYYYLVDQPPQKGPNKSYVISILNHLRSKDPGTERILMSALYITN